jgi:carotenoid cleavage dioxygenase
MSDEQTAQQTYPINKYLEGNYAPVADERVVPFEDMTVIGDIPQDLWGLYVRNGPNQRYAPLGRYHRYDGDGMLHGLYVEDGRVTYRNAWIRTACFREEDAAGTSLWGGMLDPRRTDRPDMPLKDTSNTDVILHRGKLVTTWYLAGDAYLVEPRTLHTLGRFDVNGASTSRLSAHAKVDAHTGEFVFFNYGREVPFMHYGVVDAQGALQTLLPVELPGPRLPHDMWMSQRYSVLHDMPLIYDEDAYAHGRVKLRFESEWPTRFAVMPRHGTVDSIRWFSAAPCYILHTINAWEDGDWLLLVGCRIQPHTDAHGREDLSSIPYIMGRHKLDARLYRWALNLVSGEVKETKLDADLNTEFPTWNNARTGRYTRYAYTVLIDTEPQLRFTGLVKYNTDTGARQVYRGAPGYTYSEAPFAPAVGGSAEDHGYLVTFVHNANDQRSEAHIFDARDLAAGPITRIILPVRVPEGFHATWAPGELCAAE